MKTPDGQFEVVPEHVSRLVDAHEKGLIVFKGRSCGQTYAARIALAKPVGFDDAFGDFRLAMDERLIYAVAIPDPRKEGGV